jgi:hypothetical protein
MLFQSLYSFSERFDIKRVEKKRQFIAVEVICKFAFIVESEEFF